MTTIPHDFFLDILSRPDDWEVTQTYRPETFDKKTFDELFEFPDFGHWTVTHGDAFADPNTFFGTVTSSCIHKTLDLSMTFKTFFCLYRTRASLPEWGLLFSADTLSEDRWTPKGYETSLSFFVLKDSGISVDTKGYRAFWESSGEDEEDAEFCEYRLCQDEKAELFLPSHQKLLTALTT